MKNASRRKKSRLINLFVAIVSHNRNSTTNSQDRPMVLLSHSRKSQNPMKNKVFDTRYLFCYLKNHHRKMCVQMHSDALRGAFLKRVSLETMSFNIKNWSKSSAVCLDASVRVLIDARMRVKVFYKHNRFLVSSALRTMRAALFFGLTQIVINMQATDDRKISRASVRLRA